MNILPGNMRFGAGQPVKRLEDQRLLTGKGQFIDDRPEDGALWLHVLRSPHAHAKLVSIDTKAAASMPGVEAVYTGADLIADDIGTLPTLLVFKRPAGSPVVCAEVPDNIVAAMSYGDAAVVDAAFAKAAHVVSLDLVSQRLIPSAMEPRSTIAEVDKKSGRLTLYVQSQTPGSTRDLLAEAVLKRPKESIRVLV